MPRRAISYGLQAAIDSPRKTTSPRESASAPEIRLNIVLLPAPFGPMSPRISPEAIENERSLTATSPPNSLRAARTSSSGPAGGDRSRAGSAPASGTGGGVDFGSSSRDPWPDALARTLQQHDHQHAEDDDLEVAALAEQRRQDVLQHLLRERDQRRADHRAPHAAGAADDRHEQVLDALVDVERRRVHEALQVRVQPPRNAREQRRVDEHDDLEPRAVDAERLGHLDLAAQRADRASGPRIEQVGGRPQRRERDGPDQEVEVALVAHLDAEEMQRGNAGDPRVAAEELQVPNRKYRLMPHAIVASGR